MDHQRPREMRADVGTRLLYDYHRLSRYQKIIQERRALAELNHPSESVIDSTLILIMNEVESLAAPAGLAVIACGDLKADDMLRKLRYMSYMIPASEPASRAVLTSQIQS